MTSEKRSLLLDQFEKDSLFRYCVAQNTSVQTGSNARAVDKIIFEEKAPVEAHNRQCIGRAQRLIFKENAHFAKREIEVEFLAPRLHPQALAEVEDSVIRGYLEQGTIHKRWVANTIQAIHEFDFLTSRGCGSAYLPDDFTVEKLLNDWEKAVESLRANTTNSPLLSLRTGTPLLIHNNSMKNAWRRDVFVQFGAQELPKLNAPLTDIHVACTGGPEALEAEAWISLGIPPRNVHVFESGDRATREICLENCNRLGCHFHGGKMEDIAPHLGIPFRLITADPNGYFTDSLLQMFLRMKVSEDILILKNAGMQREQLEPREALTLMEGNRAHLDTVLFKLIGTASSQPSSFTSADVIRLAKFGRMTAHAIAKPLSEAIDISEERCKEYLTELHQESPHIKSFKQVHYQSKNGLRFLSTLARITPWNPQAQVAPSISALRSFMNKLVQLSSESYRHPRLNDIECRHRGNVVDVTHASVGTISLIKSELLENYQYFASAVDPQFQLKALFESTVPTLKLG